MTSQDEVDPKYRQEFYSIKLVKLHYLYIFSSIFITSGLRR